MSGVDCRSAVRRPFQHREGRLPWQGASPASWVRGLLAVSLAAALVGGGRYAIDALFIAPWGYATGGRPVLTGSWVGTFALPSGLEFALYLDLKHDAFSFGQPMIESFIGARLSGDASWCDSGGHQALDVPLSGAVRLLSGYNPSAGDLEIDVYSEVQPAVGLLPDVFTGSWQAGALVLRPTFSYGTGKAFEYTRDNLDLTAPLLVRLHRGDEVAFRELCVSIGSVHRQDNM